MPEKNIGYKTSSLRNQNLLTALANWNLNNVINFYNTWPGIYEF